MKALKGECSTQQEGGSKRWGLVVFVTGYAVFQKWQKQKQGAGGLGWDQLWSSHWCWRTKRAIGLTQTGNEWSCMSCQLTFPHKGCPKPVQIRDSFRSPSLPTPYCSSMLLGKPCCLLWVLHWCVLSLFHRVQLWQLMLLQAGGRSLLCFRTCLPARCCYSWDRKREAGVQIFLKTGGSITVPFDTVRNVVH